jgi:tetraacyldisaccharide 4'-kinase
MLIIEDFPDSTVQTPMNKSLKALLYPFSFVYGTIVFLRNKLYDYKVFNSVEFHLPVISVGNITVGGTGKTPHAEYLIRLLKDEFTVAFLSRGYKRKTAKFTLATELSTAETIGDEPFQIKRKFPDLIVAVDRNRVKGIYKLLESFPDIDIVIIDDGYQHRRLSPGINILLIDFEKPLQKDFLLPFGRLREHVSEKSRADMIIVTKVPTTISPMDKRLFAWNTGIKPYQSVFFTTIGYGKLKPVFNVPEVLPELDLNDKNLSVVIVSAIADPSQLVSKISQTYKNVIQIHYSDHHVFTQSDINNIIKKYQDLPGKEKIIITTEKDAARLLPFNSEVNIPAAWYYLPIQVEFLSNEEELFNRHILHYVNNNSKNSILFKK